MKRKVVIVAPPNATLLDITGPYEVFSRAGGYAVEVVSTARSRRVKTRFGLEIVCAQTIAGMKGSIDTLLIAGGPEPVTGTPDPQFRRWLQRTAPVVRRMCSVCTGSFYLADAGLLANRRATTHWRYCDLLAGRYPDIQVDPEPIFVRDGHFYTSAGITAGIDLALALVEEDHGHQLAQEIARDLVVFLRRSGSQAQFSATLSQQMAERKSIRELQHWIVDHLDARTTVEYLAAFTNMSPRNFARIFARETGTTPGRFLEQLRVEAARRFLAETTESLDSVASQVGFGSSKSMQRAFVRKLGTTPAGYRHQIKTTSIQ